VAFSPDGRRALSGSGDNTLKLWEVNSGREIRTFQGHSNLVNAVAFSSDGRRALSGSWDHTLKLWEVNSGREIRTFQGHSSDVTAVAFSPDGRMALSGSEDNTLKLWEINSGREIRTFQGHSNEVNAVAFSPDGRLALSGSYDHTLKLWEVNSGREIRTFQGHSYYVIAVAFSPDGQLALSGSRNGSNRLWNVQTGDEIAQMVSFKDGEWATVTGQGYYVASSTKAEERINVRTGPTQVSGIAPYRNQFKRPDLVAAILQAGELDRQAPRIEVYPKQRGIENELVLDTYRYTLHGQAIDKSKISTVTINGNTANLLDNQGNFTYDLQLQEGKNTTQITATDIFANTARKTITLVYSPSPLKTVNNYALIIGINNYQDSRVTQLDTAVNDAQAVANLLKNHYAFQVTTLINNEATRSGILQTFDKLAKQAQANDNLLVYYAGHGQRDLQKDKAYWFPVDANIKYEHSWIIADRITAYMKSSQATNVLVIADSCYSGAIAKQRNIYMPSGLHQDDRHRSLAQLKQTASRILIASGGNQPVSDGQGGKHSIFAQALLNGLKTPKQDFTAHELFIYVQQRVAGNSSQLPGIHFIINSGHQGGDFVFEPRAR